LVIVYLFLLFAPCFIEAQEITAEIEMGDHIEFQPLKGLITITHNKSDKIDTASFRLQDKPLEVELVQEVNFAANSPLLVTFYRFTLPGQTRGLHELPPISVKIGKDVVTSIPSTYTVGVLASGGPSNGVVLRFDNMLEGNRSLYPGQRIKLGYRYTFSGSIELNEETLPLLEATGLLKIGAKSIKDYVQGQLNIREVTQEYEAKEPGEYNFGPSSIQGNAYTQGLYGRRQYLQPPVQAGTPAVTISVKPFPDQGKPPSFNGAVGPFDHFTVKLLSASKITIGDKIVLSVEIGGKGQLADVPMPELCCQPGFSGLFKLSDLPPTEQAKGPNIKQFVVEMRPLSASIKELPPVEFSYFDPDTKSYQILHSQAIPLTIAALPPPAATPTAKPAEKVDTTASHGDVAHNLSPIEIESLEKLTSADLSNRLFGTWDIFWSLPIGLVGLLLQFNYYKVLQRERAAPRSVEAEALLEGAKQATKGSAEFFRLLSQALILRLKEQGHITTLYDNASQLPAEGAAGRVRDFLLQIDEMRFTGREQELGKSLLQQATTLFKEL
jgi:hypothetical protein